MDLDMENADVQADMAFWPIIIFKIIGLLTLVRFGLDFLLEKEAGK